ncbi:alpha/beta-hydrolase [Myriangium duriaei CBS 260.36]|uniref:Carboxylic ester hydrolase n=1 Tax=Myriangium duriaei CBS 260.36 TaxID=1168546 RepID=A0A9P4JAR2_9PEZI|nr:alpha/beta-hydrolase [Myriangium duriaei CBS 260.36]
MLFKSASTLLAFASSVLALPHDTRASNPTAITKNGTVTGASANGIESFMGIPFALPPVGPLRLKPPQSYNQAYPGGSFTATNTPRACPQFQGSFSALELSLLSAAANTVGNILDIPFFHIPTETGEDCLTLNVQRPAGTAANAKLPVLLYIFGGGFEFGSTQSYDGSKIINAGVSGTAKGHPVIYVAINYRVAGFGFLAGKELKADGSTNLGLRDQRLALQWVAENIAAFGGDPSKVTIWGESAGAISVFDHLLINGGDNTYNGQPLFRGAIMDSGSVAPAEPVDTPKAQNIYDAVVQKAGCGGQSDTLACLRTVPYDTLLTAVNSVPAILSYSALDLSYLPRPDPTDNFFPDSPDDAIAKKAYAKVPIIIGDQEDEGTLFALFQPNITNQAQVVEYLQSYFPTVADPSLIPNLVASYPDHASAGSPFNTGILYNIYPEFKRMAAILGDITFTLTRRATLSVLSTTQPSWSYIDSHLYLLPILGTFHATDVLESFDGTPAPLPAQTYQTYYTSFAYYLDPNQISTKGPLINWPQYTNQSPLLLHLYALYNTVMEDNFRMDQFKALNASFGQLKI